MYSRWNNCDTRGMTSNDVPPTPPLRRSDGLLRLPPPPSPELQIIDEVICLVGQNNFPACQKQTVCLAKNGTKEIAHRYLEDPENSDIESRYEQKPFQRIRRRFNCVVRNVLDPINTNSTGHFPSEPKHRSESVAQPIAPTRGKRNLSLKKLFNTIRERMQHQKHTGLEIPPGSSELTMPIDCTN